MKSSGNLIARNTVYNFLTQLLVAAVAVVSIPVIVRAIGEESFGLLTVAWMVVGYFSILDLGVGQASIKFLSEYYSREEWDIANRTVVSSVFLSIIFGCITSVILLLLTPLLIESVLHIPGALQPTASTAFSIVAIAIPFVMLQGAFRAVPAAVQRFDLINIVQGTSGLIQWGGALILVLLGKNLIAILVLTVLLRVCTAIWLAIIALKLFPGMKFNMFRFRLREVSHLLKFGGWLTVSQIVSPVVRYLDRVLVASYCSLRMFTFYSVPYEAVSRLQVIPSSFSTTLYPALAERDGGNRNNPQSVASLYSRSMNFMVITMLPVSIFLAVFSRQVLHLWLGGDFPILSSTVFSVLSMATFVQAVGYVPVTYLQSVGRPHIAARFYLAEVPLYLFLCFFLIPRFGIEGAAWAWLIRLLIIVPGLLIAVARTIPAEYRYLNFHLTLRSVLLNAIIFILFLIQCETMSLSIILVIALLGTSLFYAWGIWRFCLDGVDRSVVRNIIKPGA